MQQTPLQRQAGGSCSSSIEHIMLILRVLVQLLVMPASTAWRA